MESEVNATASPRPESVLIVGAGQAGIQAAQSLRKRGYEGEITMLGNEGHAPYQRPPLSKAFLIR